MAISLGPSGLVLGSDTFDDISDFPSGTIKQVTTSNWTSRISASNYTTFGFSPGGRGTGYNTNVKISHSITKSAGTDIIVDVEYAFKNATNGHGTHGFVIWKDSSNYVSYGCDIHQDFNQAGVLCHFQCSYRFTGLGAGSHTFYCAPARCDGTSFGVILNPTSGDVDAHVALPGASNSASSYMRLTEVST